MRLIEIRPRVNSTILYIGTTRIYNTINDCVLVWSMVYPYRLSPVPLIPVYGIHSCCNADCHFAKHTDSGNCQEVELEPNTDFWIVVGAQGAGDAQYQCCIELDRAKQLYVHYGWNHDKRKSGRDWYIRIFDTNCYSRRHKTSCPLSIPWSSILHQFVSIATHSSVALLSI